MVSQCHTELSTTHQMGDYILVEWCSIPPVEFAHTLTSCIPTDTSAIHSTHISTLSSDSPQIRITVIVYSSNDI